MPYLEDPRRTVTLNLHPDAYAALAEDALEAGYPTPGTYAKALVANRGDAPAPISDQRCQARLDTLQVGHAWLLHQFETAQRLLKEAGISLPLSDLPAGEYRPRSRAAQQRATQRAVREALAAERAARRARGAAKKVALVAAAPPVPPLPASPAVAASVPRTPIKRYSGRAANPAGRDVPVKPHT